MSTAMTTKSNRTSSKEDSARSRSNLLPGRVLIADDEHLIAAGLSANLRELGCEVIGPASNGQIAIDLARQTLPDMALLDIRMPLLDGLSAAKTIWDELGIPVVIISAYSDPQNVERCSEIGVFGYLLKPADPNGLRVSLSVAWSRAQMQKESGERIVQLERNLQNRRTVEQAKWKLVERCGISEPEAHRRLQTTARNTRSPLVDVATRVIEEDATLAD